MTDFSELFGAAFPDRAAAVATSYAPEVVLVRLLAALLLGWLVSEIYRRSRRPAERAASFTTTLILLTVLIALSTQVIGDNVARAFGLVGALSIVRFRTVVRDTRDTAFVIFAVVIGMAVGAHNLLAGSLGVGVVGAAVWWRAVRARGDRNEAVPLRLTVRTALGDPVANALALALEDSCLDFELVAVGTTSKGVGIEKIFELRLRPQATAEALVRTLNDLDGVQSVDCRRADLDL